MKKVMHIHYLAVQDRAIQNSDMERRALLIEMNIYKAESCLDYPGTVYTVVNEHHMEKKISAILSLWVSGSLDIYAL